MPQEQMDAKVVAPKLTKSQINYRKYKHCYVRWRNSKKGKASFKRRLARYRKSHPWFKTYCSIKARINFPKPHYVGIKNYLSTADLKMLWFRDKAFLLKRPSIDRYDHKGHYCIENCHYIELSDNSKEGVTRRHLKEGHNVKRLHHHN